VPENYVTLQLIQRQNPKDPAGTFVYSAISSAVLHSYSVTVSENHTLCDCTWNISTVTKLHK